MLPLAELPRKDVSNTSTATYTAFGQKLMFGRMEFPANSMGEQFAGDFWSLTEKLLRAGTIKVHPPQVREGGLEGLLKRLQGLREKKGSGVELVYNV